MYAIYVYIHIHTDTHTHTQIFISYSTNMDDSMPKMTRPHGHSTDPSPGLHLRRGRRGGGTASGWEKIMELNQIIVNIISSDYYLTIIR